MTISLRRLFAIAGEYLPEQAINPGITAAVRKVVPLISNSCSSYYLEWHLSEPWRSDLLGSLSFDNRLSLRGKSGSVRQGKVRQNGWSTLRRFIACWKSIHRQPRSIIPHIWFALDYNGEMRFDPPNIHYCIDRHFSDRRHPPRYLNKLSQSAFNRIVAFLSEQCYQSISPQLHPLMKQCFKALQDHDGEVIHLSFMHQRTPPVIKLNMTIPVSRLAGFLDNIKWHGDIKTVTALCKRYAPDEHRIKGNVCLTYDYPEGFELELEYNTPLANDLRRPLLLKSMVRHELMTRLQMKQLLLWPGRVAITYRNLPHTVERWLDIKISFSGKGRITAKAYLGFASLPRIGWRRERHDDQIA